MYNNDYMYAIERSDDYLAHYGVRGMRWGVRKAREMGGARGAALLSKQYAKAQKKLAKLEKRAGKASKYGKRAALYGAGAAAAGGLAALGTGGVGRMVARGGDVAAKASHAIGSAMIRVPGTSKAAQGIHRAGSAMMTAGGVGKGRGAIRKAGGNARRAIEQWGKSTSISDAAANAIGQNALRGSFAATRKFGTGNIASKAGFEAANGANKLRGITNNTIARVGAGAVAAGLGAAAAKNAYRAATAKKKAERFRTEMNKAFAGTQYARGGNSAPRQGNRKRRRR